MAQKLQKQIDKTALGATGSVPFEYHDNLLTWINGNTQPLVALEQTPNSVMLDAYRAPDDFVLVLGEEVDGIAPDLLSVCETAIEIPMRGTKESFNVSIAAAVALYALTR